MTQEEINQACENAIASGHDLRTWKSVEIVNDLQHKAEEFEDVPFEFLLSRVNRWKEFLRWKDETEKILSDALERIKNLSLPEMTSEEKEEWQEAIAGIDTDKYQLQITLSLLACMYEHKKGNHTRRLLSCPFCF